MKYNKQTPLRVFTAFSGYDSQCLALNMLKEKHPEFDYELVGWSEINKYAIMAHNALFPQYSDRNYGDISKINWEEVPDFDLLTWSSPCQDISNAGLQKGLTKGSNTRSSLIWCVLDAIRVKRPRYIFMENVKALVGQKFIKDFNSLVGLLQQEFGYNTYWKVLNTLDFGIPQNRERVYAFSILDDLEDRTQAYGFPKPFPLKVKLEDVLEDEVDESYFVSEKALASMIAKTRSQREVDPKKGITTAL